MQLTILVIRSVESNCLLIRTHRCICGLNGPVNLNFEQLEQKVIVFVTKNYPLGINIYLRDWKFTHNPEVGPFFDTGQEFLCIAMIGACDLE